MCQVDASALHAAKNNTLSSESLHNQSWVFESQMSFLQLIKTSTSHRAHVVLFQLKNSAFKSNVCFTLKAIMSRAGPSITTPASEECRKFSIKPSESLTPRWDWRHCSRHKTEWHEDRGEEGGGGRGGSKDRNVVVDLGAVPLCDALGDPHNVPALLLLQLDVGVEDTEVELVEEGQLVQLHLQGGRGRGKEGEEETEGWVYRHHQTKKCQATS